LFTTTTTTTSPTTDRTTTITKGVDANGNEIKKRHLPRRRFRQLRNPDETLTDPDGGTTTRSKTTTEQR
jgi:hypothetical protein